MLLNVSFSTSLRALTYAFLTLFSFSFPSTRFHLSAWFPSRLSKCIRHFLTFVDGSIDQTSTSTSNFVFQLQLRTSTSKLQLPSTSNFIFELQLQLRTSISKFKLH